MNKKKSCILLIDNYDSFTYNLVQAFQAEGAEVLVFRNDKINSVTAKDIKPTHIVISPGPGNPGNAGVSVEIIDTCLLYTSPSPRDATLSRMPSSA